MVSLRRIFIVLSALFVLMGLSWEAGLLPAMPGDVHASQAPSGSQFTSAQLEQLVAPVALYPDSLLAQVLMASTYPLEVVQAARWVKSNPGLKGDQLQSALAQKTWDPSVKSLVLFPDVLSRMNDNLDWTQDLGDAFLTQQQDVMDTVQRLRNKAYASGNLKSSKEQKVVVQQQVIQIEPVATEVVYVPVYNPTVVYGPSWYYPTWYYPSMMVVPAGYVATSNLISFGLGVAVGAAMFGNFDWHTHNIYINNNYYNNRIYHGGDIVNRNTIIDKNGRVISGSNVNFKQNPDARTVWQHDADHRRDVAYRDNATANRFDQAGTANRNDLRNFRGFDGSGADNLRSTDRSPGGDATRGMDRPGTDRQGPETLGGDARRNWDSGGAGRDRVGGPGSTWSGDMGGDRPGGGGRQSAFSNFGSGDFEHAFSNRGGGSRGLGGFGGGMGGFHRR